MLECSSKIIFLRTFAEDEFIEGLRQSFSYEVNFMIDFRTMKLWGSHAPFLGYLDFELSG
ncbi:hypothetical protein GIB67_015271 [Kingdonia uniflora]|uniref:Uncharacterized protein n=1 Tax=Kingdonia uniflora TaxID=39325 RepID=A0A7J7MSS3_9MAGN|nr:hypothetical protein GIB67_015271 [Kingdonia uniflora]